MQIIKESLESVLNKTRYALIVEVQSVSAVSDGPYHRELDVTARLLKPIFGQWTAQATFVCRYSEGLPHQRGNKSISPLVTGSGLELEVQNGEQVILLLADDPIDTGACTLLRIEPITQVSFLMRRYGDQK